MGHVPWALCIVLSAALMLGGILPSASATDHARPTSVSGATGIWLNITRGVHPQTSEDNNMAYDTADHEAVVFSGWSYAGGGADLPDTWTYSAGNWTDLNLSSAASPPPTESYGFAYDSSDGYAVLFGGVGSGCPTVCSYTWTFSGGAWTELHPSTAPPARWEAGMAYDAADGYIVLFGGVGCHNPSCSFPRNPLGDTWTFKAGVWTNITSSAGTAPSPREAPSMVYDSTDGYVLLNGGYRCSLCQNYANDTWEFKAGHWTELSSSGGPPQNSFMSDDPKDGYVVAYGGVGTQGCASTITWAFNGGTWNQVSATGAPYREAAHPVYDSADGYVLLFGGIGSNNGCSGQWFTDTWKYVGTGSSSPGPGGGSCAGCISVLGVNLTYLQLAILTAVVAAVVSVAVIAGRKRKRQERSVTTVPPPSYPGTTYMDYPPAHHQTPPGYSQDNGQYVDRPGPPPGYRGPPGG